MIKLKAFLVSLLIANTCFTQTYPNEVVYFNQGKRVNGTNVLVQRSISSNALFQPQDSDAFSQSVNFVSLGFGGEIILKFEQPILNGFGNDIKIFETTWEYGLCYDYPEKASVWVSYDGIDYGYLGYTCLNGSTEFDLESINYSFCQYIKIKDESTIDSFLNFVQLADGYDLDGVTAVHGSFSPLSISLIYFEVELVNDLVKLSWSTGSETNNNYFLLLVSKDLLTFEEVRRVPGAGNSSLNNYYTSFDEIRFKDQYYYILKSVDFNGVIEDLKIVPFLYESKKIKKKIRLNGTELDLNNSSNERGLIITIFENGDFIKTYTDD